MPIDEAFKGSVKYTQIMDKDGNADERLNPKLPSQLLVKLYVGMLVARMFDDKALKLQRQGRLFTYAPSLGQEAAQIGSVAALHEDDWMFPSFREHGVYLWRGMPMKQLFLYFAGREMGMRMEPGSRNLTVTVPIATQTLHAVGASWAAKLQNQKSAAIVYFGDGATSEGDFHCAMNFAGVFKTPTVFFCQNNQWAISMPRKKQSASKTLAQKALAYGFEGVQIDGNDVLASYAATRYAIEKARRGDGPTLIEAVTYRISHHTTADDATRYRDPEELKYWLERDPIKRFRRYLELQNLWDADKEKAVTEKISAQIEQAVADMEAEPEGTIDEVFGYTWAKMPPYLFEEKRELQEYWAERRQKEGGQGTGGAGGSQQANAQQ